MYKKDSRKLLACNLFKAAYLFENSKEKGLRLKYSEKTYCIIVNYCSNDKRKKFSNTETLIFFFKRSH